MHSKQFEIVREKSTIEKAEYVSFDASCPACGKGLYVQKHDTNRQYCNNSRCNAMILEE